MMRVSYRDHRHTAGDDVGKLPAYEPPLGEQPYGSLDEEEHS